MSNDQSTSPPFLTPIILQTPSQINQKEFSCQFLRNHYGWPCQLTDPNLKILNQEQTSISIETVRQLIGELGYATLSPQPRMILLLAADQLTPAAQHALLKSLEEPPANTLIVLVTDEPQQLLTTIRSRCILHQPQYATSTTTDNLEPHIPPLIKALILNKKEVRYHHIIELVAEYKSKEQAIELMRRLVYWLHSQPHQDQRLIRIQQLVISTLAHVQGNANPSLALENMLFSIKTSQ